MKLYLAYVSEYGDRIDLGIFSSKEKAEESLKKFIPTASNWTHDTEGSVEEFDLDIYYIENFSPLALALSEKDSDEL